MNVNINRRALRETNSILRYESVASSSLPYSVVDGSNYSGTPFKGIHVETSGSITIVGVDSQPISLTLSPGFWPYGGIGITASTINPIKVLF